METYIAAWAILEVASIVGVIFWARRGDPCDWTSALRWSLLAALPGLPLLLEFVFHIPGWTKGHHTRTPIEFFTLWPVAGALVFALVPLVISYIDAPPLQGPFRFELVRLLHVASWILSAGAVLWSLVAAVAYV